MRKLTILAVALAALLAPRAADAQFVLGARLAYVMPGGEFAQDSNYDEFIKSSINLQLDAGYMVIPNLTIGAYFGYGFASAGDGEGLCTLDGVDCSAKLMRFGVEATYGFPVSPAVTIWGGLGIGMEWLTFEATDGTDTLTLSASTWELPTLSAGADFAVGGFKLGPYLSYGMGTFKEAKLDDGTNSETADIVDTAGHNYFTLGVRGVFGL